MPSRLPMRTEILCAALEEGHIPWVLASSQRLVHSNKKLVLVCPGMLQHSRDCQPFYRPLYD